MSLSEVYSLSEDVKYNVIEDEALVLDLETGRYFTANKIGTRILDMIKAGRSLDNIVADLKKDYDVDEQTLRRDVANMIKKLVSENIVNKSTGVLREKK